jgi:hypothetical protein
VRTHHRRHRRHRTGPTRLARLGGLAALTVACMLLLTGCGGGGGGTPVRTLGEVLTSIAHSQGVDIAVVRSAVSQEARAAKTSELALAKEWDAALPAEPLPKLDNAWNMAGDYAAEQLKGSTCAAIFDTLRDQEVPTGQEFFDNYLDSLATGRLPNAQEREIMEEFDSLYTEAENGTLTVTDIRFTLMKLRYC